MWHFFPLKLWSVSNEDKALHVPPRHRAFEMSPSNITLPNLNTIEQCFLVIRGLYTTCMPARKPPRAYAAAKGAYASSQLPGGYADAYADVQLKYRSALWLLQHKDRDFSVQVQFWQPRLKDHLCNTSENPHLSKDLAARKCLESPCAGPARSLRED